MSDCGCVFVDDDGDVASMHTTATATARKEHICTECRGTIAVGTAYERVVGKWERLEVFKTCPVCLSVRDVFFCGQYVYGVIWNDLKNHPVEIEGNVSSECLMELSEEARGRVIALIQKVWEK